MKPRKPGRPPSSVRSAALAMRIPADLLAQLDARVSIDAATDWKASRASVTIAALRKWLQP